jgi:uncharacterized protein YbjT (DUF2867 family)
MNNAKTIFVTGATGNQGGAVANNFLKNGYRVKALTRNPDSDKAKKLRAAGAELVKGDLNDVDSYKDKLNGVDGVFSVQTFEKGPAKEIARGINLAAASKDNNVSHFLYSSVIASDLKTGIPHFESKFQVEEYIRKSGIPYTIIRPASLYENFLIPQVRKGILKGKLVSPLLSTAVQQYIASEDIGKISAHIFSHKDQYLGKTFEIASEEMDVQSVADVFSQALSKPVKYAHLPGILTRIFMGKDLYTMFKYVNDHNLITVKNIPALKKEFPFMMPLKEWIVASFLPVNTTAAGNLTVN